MSRGFQFQKQLLYPFLIISAISPSLRKRMWQWWYQKLAGQISTDSWTFMNYGFLPTPRPAPASASEDAQKIPVLNLNPEDEADRLCIQLYEQVAKPADLAGKEVLEVSSGRGGGASYLARYHHPRKYTGIDFAQKAVAFANNRHKDVANLTFTLGDAEHIPFPDKSFDVVVNVESSHCYGDTKKFLQEVARILRPGGFFVFADLRGTAEMAELKKMLAEQPLLQQVEEENITANVIAALKADDKRKQAMINQLVQPRLQPVFEEFAGVAGGKVFQGLEKGNLQYSRFAFRRIG